ncbi:MAG: flagellin [Roseiarcus sp.]|jgi:flagellin
MSSILTNPSALSALQALQMTQNEMNQTQNQVSTGLAVATAADNASYWSIATQLNSDSGVVAAANNALAESQSVLDTASSAISSVITTINSIQAALTQATNPGADIGNINTTLASLGQQLSDAVNGASFNGLNLLDGSQLAALNFVAGFNASAAGGSFNNISFTAQALTGAGGVASTSQEANITDAATIAALNALPDNHTATVGYGQDVVTNAGGGATTITVESQSLTGVDTTTTYTGLDANGNTVSAATAVAFGVSVTTTPPAGLLTQGATDLTNIQIGGATTAATALSAVETALSAVTNYAATIGATQDRMTAASTFNSSLTTNYAEGVSALVDANMNTASTRLQALQTQEQLGIQSLSIANQNAQLLLKLFSNV